MIKSVVVQINNIWPETGQNTADLQMGMVTWPG